MIIFISEEFLTKNIYNLFREYNRLLTLPQKAKYIASMNYDTRETFKSLINYANNSDRFENIYDGWIDNLDDELVVLEVYSVILSTRRNLQQFCVDDKTYKDFIDNKKKMLKLLLKNKQYKHASTLLDVHKLPSYLTTDIDGDFKFSITNDVISLTALKEDVESELNKSVELKKIVDNLVEKNSVK